MIHCDLCPVDEGDKLVRSPGSNVGDLEDLVGHVMGRQGGRADERPNGELQKSELGYRSDSTVNTRRTCW